MKLNKIIIFTLYTLIIACIGFATVIEKYRDTLFVSEHIYGAWWFTALWAVLTVASLAYIMQQRLYKRVAVMLLHLSFVVILVGALTTHLFAQRGTMRLWEGVTESTFVDKDNKVVHLPFALTLKEFRIINYPGTDAPLDYQSHIDFKRLNSDSKASCGGQMLVSMNNIGYLDHYRFFQQSYNSDGKGVTLGVSYDPYGIGITYFGYLLLLVGIIATLLSRHTQMRSLYRKAIAVAVLLVSFSVSASADNSPLSVINSQFVVDKDIAQRMGTVNVLYNNRICPLNTVATDFTMKVAGRASWQGYSADQVFVSWMIYYMPWEFGRPGLRQLDDLLYAVGGSAAKPHPQPLSQGTKKVRRKKGHRRDVLQWPVHQDIPLSYWARCQLVFARRTGVATRDSRQGTVLYQAVDGLPHRGHRHRSEGPCAGDYRED